MFCDILRCLTKLIALLAILGVVCGQPVDEVVRSETLKDMRKYMNESVEPCDNFYEFACGNWPKYHPTSKETLITNIFEVISKDFDQKVKKFMKIDESADTELEQKVKSFYQSCVKVPEKWDVYTENLKKLADDFGKMPAMAGDSWQEDKFDWQETVAAIQYKYGIGSIVSSKCTNDLFDDMKKAVFIDHGSNSFDARSVYFDDKHEATRIKQKEKMAKVMTDYLAIPKDVATQTAEDIFEFEVSLAYGDTDKNLGLDLDEIYSPTTLDKLETSYSPVLNVTRFISSVFGSIPTYKYYENRNFLENLMKVMQTTPKKTVANFIYYQLFKEFVFTTLQDTKDQEKECILKVKEYFSNVFENMIYRKYATKQAEIDLKLMWGDIKSAFRYILTHPNLNWIKSVARKYSIEKLSAMELDIPAAKVNENSVNFVKQITIDKEDFVRNIKTLQSAGAANERSNLYKKPKNPIETTAELGYTPKNVLQHNKITVPVAALQSHYIFSTSLPSAFNFGRLGFLLSHRLIQGFDNTGRNYDKDGNKINWWDSDTADAFNDRGKCFIDQYEQLEFGGQKLPRGMDLRDNIADNSGLLLAYLSYQEWCRESSLAGQDPTLDTFAGFPYNNKQLFFISFGQELCGDTYPEYKRERVATDPHTPTELCAMAAVTNLLEFAEVFNCPLNSPMNPVKKCEIY